MNKVTREKLTELIETEGGNNWWNPQEFETHVRSLLPTNLQIVAPPPVSSGNYNCFVFAFGLEGDTEFLGGKNPIQQEFVRYLLEQKILKIIPKPEAGVLVFYEDSAGVITHGGIMRSSDEVLSKWMWGCLIVHKLWDVPSSFGDNVFFCVPIAIQELKNAYQAYKDTRVEIIPIS